MVMQLSMLVWPSSYRWLLVFWTKLKWRQPTRILAHSNAQWLIRLEKTSFFRLISNRTPTFDGSRWKNSSSKRFQKNRAPVFKSNECVVFRNHTDRDFCSYFPLICSCMPLFIEKTGSQEDWMRGWEFFPVFVTPWTKPSKLSWNQRSAVFAYSFDQIIQRNYASSDTLWLWENCWSAQKSTGTRREASIQNENHSKPRSNLLTKLIISGPEFFKR